MRKLPNRPSFVITERLVSYVVCGIFSLALWGISLWAWNLLFNWFVPASDRRWDWTSVLTVLALPLPFLAYRLMFSSDRPVRPPVPMPTPATPPVGGTASRSYPPGLGWLYWLGNGELHRGTMVVLVILFWSLFYWNWSLILQMIQQGEGILAFSFWGLITIFGTVIIRSVFSRIPGAEVSGSGDSKSKTR